MGFPSMSPLIIESLHDKRIRFSGGVIHFDAEAWGCSWAWAFFQDPEREPETAAVERAARVKKPRRLEAWQFETSVFIGSLCIAR